MSDRLPDPKPAKACFIGAGPADAGLLTLRGAELLSRSDVALYDARVHADVVERGPAERFVVGEGGVPDLRTSEQIATRIVRLARAGKRVARVAASDMYLFASGDEEVALVVKQGIAVEVVPGIVGSLAAGAYAGLTLSRRTDASPSVALADAREGVGLHDWTKLADATDTLAVLLARADLDELARTLVFYGRHPTTPAAILVDVARPTQEVILGTLEDIARLATALRASPIRLFVGESVTRRETLRWFDSRPLFGKRVLVTRAREEAGGTAELLRERGAEPVVIPTIAIGPPADPARVSHAVARLGEYAWIAFTSANGVEWAWRALAGEGRDARAFGATRIAAIGPATARALEGHGLRADVVAKEFKGEGLADEMLRAMASAPPEASGTTKAAAKVLVLRAAEGREVLPEVLRAAGHEVDVVAVYETRAPSDAAAKLLDAVRNGRLDAVLFTSSSTVDNLCDLLGPDAPSLLAPLRVASIGPVTSATALQRGLRVDATAVEYTTAGLIEALEGIFAG